MKRKFSVSILEAIKSGIIKDIDFDTLQQYLDEEDADYREINQPLYNNKYLANWIFDIEVCGDWKHSHLRLRYLMDLIGYSQVFERVTDEDGSDWYTAIHRYAKKEAVELFQ